MAKRRKISAPSAEDLANLEEGFRRETSSRAPVTGIAPIAQVAADAAQSVDVLGPEIRAEQARDKSDAEALRTAQSEGRVIQTLPIADIADDAMVRDRTVLLAEELEELKGSIAVNGLRLPIEVYQMPEGAEKRYGLLSGYRRLRAFRELLALTGQDSYRTIPAILRDPEAMGGAFAAMVEENEIRASLSQFERGRIAAVAAQQGAFDSTEAAVNALFKMASKAKRSKIRSFAVVYEELGDLLEFPEHLKEKEGLRLAAALRNGAEKDIRAALNTGAPATPDDEWAMLLPVIEAAERKVSGDPRRGGRPKSTTRAPGWHGQTRVLNNGVTLQRSQEGSSHIIRLQGSNITPELVEAAIERLAYLFEAPD